MSSSQTVRIRYFALMLALSVGTLLSLGFMLRSFAADLPSLEREPAPGTYQLSFEDQGVTRTAVVRVPRDYRPGEHPPAIIVLHGAGGSGEHVMKNDGWETAADAEGYLIIAPDGVAARADQEANLLTNPRLWNSGQLRARNPRARIDDVAYLKRLLDEVHQRIEFNRQRTFAAGHSNGAGMSYRLANELADQITGIGVVAGEVIANPKPSRPVPTLAIYGTEDPLRPLAGGESELPWGARMTRPVADELQEWAIAIGCQTEPTPISDSQSTQIVKYGSKNQGAELMVMYLKGHGHAWPGATRGRAIQRLLGPNNTTISAQEEILKFFKTLPDLPEPPSQ